ncbi:MAG: GHKL domain-containing protein [Burkholderiales bacterium]|nr:GHKL domain-containing protein [Burkholderiales bacterium]
MSLNARIALWGAIVLAVFILLTGIALDRAFRESASSAHEARLLGQIYLLISAAEFGKGGMVMPEALAEPRFSLPGSGLYAAVSDERKSVWRSQSVAGIAIPFGFSLQPGKRNFESRTDREGKTYFVESMGVKWVSNGSSAAFTFSVAEDLKEFDAQIAHYRHSLLSWLGIMSLLLLLTQAAVLRWGLAPLRRVSIELGEIEEGKRDRLGDYPAELSRLTESLNKLLLHERAQQKRYRDALSDLAHSLKTPLAVMRAALGADALKDTVEDEVAKMDRIVGYQLQRAATAAPSSLAVPCRIRPLVEKIANSLSKVYFDKGVMVSISVDAGISFRADEGDMMEMLGNLIDNAFKWCGKEVRISANLEKGGLRLEVEDDGPGIARDAKIMERGVRADETVPGHGIGLAVVKDIAGAYGGALEIGKSVLGGALFRIVLPER